MNAIIATTLNPSTIHGVHGAAGESYWKCFARGNALDSALEAWEYAALGPHGLNGEHHHTRTDEVYFILAGAGTMTLDGEPVDVLPGDAILTPLGARHGLQNRTADLLEWLTIEMTAPATRAALATTQPQNGAPMSTDHDAGHPTAKVVNLNDGQRLVPNDTLSPSWRALEILRLAPGEQQSLEAGQLEHAVYILSGTGSARSDGQQIELEPRLALTLPRGSSAVLHGGEDGLAAFHVELATAF
jgi:mannose-6-phosphate isomerase-like protein (cupin superfamily)